MHQRDIYFEFFAWLYGSNVIHSKKTLRLEVGQPWGWCGGSLANQTLSCLSVPNLANGGESGYLPLLIYCPHPKCSINKYAPSELSQWDFSRFLGIFRDFSQNREIRKVRKRHLCNLEEKTLYNSPLINLINLFFMDFLGCFVRFFGFVVALIIS